MKETIIINPKGDEDELLLYEITMEQKVRILATHILWSSIVFMIAMLV